MLIKGDLFLRVTKMNREFEEMARKLTPTLRRIAHKMNGHFTFFNDDDLVQEALTHLWVLFQKGILADKTDSYILQGCYFHLKNYLRIRLDKATLISMNMLIDGDETVLEDLLPVEDNRSREMLEGKTLYDSIKASGLGQRETAVLSLLLEGLTTREIGKRLGISHVMVVKIKAKIRAKCARFKN